MIPTPPRAAADRPRAAPGYMVWSTVRDVYDRCLTANVDVVPAHRALKVTSGSAPGHLWLWLWPLPLSDVPSAYGGGRDRETGTRDLNAAIAPASCAWVVWMI